jgi:hypothetical protein
VPLSSAGPRWPVPTIALPPRIVADVDPPLAAVWALAFQLPAVPLAIRQHDRGDALELAQQQKLDFITRFSSHDGFTTKNGQKACLAALSVQAGVEITPSISVAAARLSSQNSRDLKIKPKNYQVDDTTC